MFGIRLVTPRAAHRAALVRGALAAARSASRVGVAGAAPPSTLRFLSGTDSSSGGGGKQPAPVGRHDPSTPAPDANVREAVELSEDWAGPAVPNKPVHGESEERPSVDYAGVADETDKEEREERERKKREMKGVLF